MAQTQHGEDRHSSSGASARLRLVAEVIRESFEHPNETSVINRATGKVVARRKDDDSSETEKEKNSVA